MRLADHADPLVRMQIELRLADAQVAVAVAQAALALDREIEVLVPVVAAGDRAAAAFQMQREPVRVSHAHVRAVGLDHRVEVPRPRQSVEIACVDQQAHLEREGPGRHRSAGQQPPADVRGVLAVLHPHPVLHAQLTTGVTPDRDAPVEVEGLDVEIAGWRHRAAAPAVAEQRPLALAVAQRRVGLRHHQVAPERRVDRRHQQAVVAPRECSRDGACGIPAQAVGQPPLAALGLGQVAADLSAESDQFR